METVIIDFKCNLCNKKYSSYQSLWIHNKKFHNTKNETITTIHEEKNIKCEYCNKIFSSRSAKSDHKKKACKKNPKNKTDDNSRDELLRKELSEIKNTLAQIINKNAKIHPKTLQKINKNLINNSQSTNNSNNTINNNSNNTTNNTINNTINNTFVKFGEIKYSKILSEKAILNILNKPFMSLEESIQSIHFNKDHPEYHNIYITNMKDNLAYIFDGKTFISVRKNDIIDELIELHKEEIETTFEEYKDKMSELRIRRLNVFLELINNEGKFTDIHNKVYSSYKAYKISDITRFIYNNCDNKKFDLLKNIELKEKVI